ncbi:hypothetical protein EON77_10145, partial [bacterium]
THAGLNDTWAFEGDTWREMLDVARPPPSADAAMAFSAPDDALLLDLPLGTSTDVGPTTQETWAHDGIRWRRVATRRTLSARSSIVFDGYEGAVVRRTVWFEFDTDSPAEEEFALWRGGWETTRRQAPSGVAVAARVMAFDDARREMIGFGGWVKGKGAVAETSRLSRGTVTPIAVDVEPSARQSHAMTYFPTMKRVALFGGIASNTTALDDTWIWDGSSWEKLDTIGSPGPRYAFAFVYEPSRDRALLFGGIDSAEGTRDDTWALVLEPSSKMCSRGDECASGFCVDGFCCDRACGGVCETCSDATWPGTCALRVGAPLATHGACVTPCGACDGSRSDACTTTQPSGTPCGANGCVDNRFRVSSCTSDGACASTRDDACGAFACGAEGCAQSCADDEACALGFACQAGSSTCVPAAKIHHGDMGRGVHTALLKRPAIEVCHTIEERGFDGRRAGHRSGFGRMRRMFSP